MQWKGRNDRRWVPWFAWYPVRVTDYDVRWVWLEKVMLCGRMPFREYRHIPR